VTMPLVIGQTEAEARASLTSKGLQVASQTDVSDAQPAGHVFAQDPQAAAKVDKGAQVTIHVAAPPVQVKVANVVGKNVDDARQLLEALGLNVKTDSRTDPKIASNVVISQTPAPESGAAKGSDVTLVVSSGKAKKAVPDETGKDQVDAANELGGAGFKINKTTEASKSVAQGKVVRTDPPANEQADEGSTITMVVSSGPEQATVPNVMGKSADDARRDIEAAGLVYKEGSPAPSNASDDGKVVAQTPSGGVRADPGSTVTVRLGRATIGGTTTTL
jgi:beta-lactam-binding protein with PASTA domain